jgi:N-acetylglucosamine-6-sulfatase
MHVDTSNVAKRHTGLFGFMKDLGYEVGVFGKVTNDQTGVLKLMSDQNSSTWISSPIDYNNYDGVNYYNDFGNGTIVHETLSKTSPVYGTVYQSVQIGNRTIDWLDKLHSQGSTKPFFAYLGPHAPHYPATPAPWYEHAFDDVTIPITPNYNTSFEDKTRHIRQNPPLSERALCWQNQHFRDRWASLLSVDDMVLAVTNKLTEMGVLDKTYIFYSSDHGYKQGQWRVGTSKEHPFETDIRVPLIVRGPRITPGTVFPHMTGNVDVTPTILDLAGLTTLPSFMDGKSMRPWLLAPAGTKTTTEAGASTTGAVSSTNTDGWRDRWLIEYLSVGTYYNDHSSAWQDGNNTTEKCGGPMPRSPDHVPAGAKCVETTGVGDGNCYFVDSTESNSWRSLRVINATHDFSYTEYDKTWKFNGSSIQFRELYDLKTDPFQMKNIYDAQSDTDKTELNSELQTYWLCKGDQTTQSDCP